MARVKVHFEVWEDGIPVDRAVAKLRDLDDFPGWYFSIVNRLGPRTHLRIKKATLDGQAFDPSAVLGVAANNPRARRNPRYALVDVDRPGTVLPLKARSGEAAVAEAHRAARAKGVERYKVVLLNPEYAAALAANNPPVIMYYWGDDPNTSNFFILDNHPSFKREFRRLKKSLGQPKFVYLSRKNPEVKPGDPNWEAYLAYVKGGRKGRQPRNKKEQEERQSFEERHLARLRWKAAHGGLDQDELEFLYREDIPELAPDYHVWSEMEHRSYMSDDPTGLGHSYDHSYDGPEDFSYATGPWEGTKEEREDYRTLQEQHDFDWEVYAARAPRNRLDAILKDLVEKLTKKNPSRPERNERMIQLVMRTEGLSRKEAEKRLKRAARSVALGNPREWMLVGVNDARRAELRKALREYGYSYSTRWTTEGRKKALAVRINDTYVEPAGMRTLHRLFNEAGTIVGDVGIPTGDRSWVMEDIQQRKAKRARGYTGGPSMPGYRERGKPSARKPRGKKPISSRARKELARWNSRTRPVYVLMWEHKRGKRGKIMGLPGADHVEFRKMVPREPKASVLKRAQDFARMLSRGSARGYESLMLLDADGNEVSLQTGRALANPMYRANIGNVRPTFTLMWEDVGAKGKDTAVFVRDPGEKPEAVWKRVKAFAKRLPHNEADMIAFDEDGFEVSMRTGKNNPSRARGNGKSINTYPWMKLTDTDAFVPLARRTKTSVVARSPRGFYAAFKRAKGAKSKMGRTHKDTPGRGSSYMWWQRRNEFVARHMGQVRKNGEKLWKPNGDPTKRHLGLIMWAYTPDPAGVSRWLKKKGR